jgi:hypothetical protein
VSKSAKRKTNPFSQRSLSRIKQAGLPTPDPNLSKTQFAKLQKQWYSKAAESGFEDIEWVNHATGAGHDSGFLKGSLAGGKAYHPGRALYYQLATNYLVHCQNLQNKPYNKFIWKLHAEGATYDELLKQVRKKFGNAPSKYTLYYQIKELAQRCYIWNATNPEGLIVKRKEDKNALEDRGLEDFYADEYNWILSKEPMWISPKK